MNRREALKTLGGFAAGLYLPGNLSTGFVPHLRPVGVQVYTVRASRGQDVEATLDADARLGVREGKDAR